MKSAWEIENRSGENQSWKKQKRKEIKCYREISKEMEKIMPVIGKKYTLCLRAEAQCFGSRVSPDALILTAIL